MNYITQYHKASMPLTVFRKKYQDRGKYMAYCRECPNFGTVWSCPSLSFDVDTYLSDFTWVNILGARVILNDRVIADADTPDKIKSTGWEILLAVKLDVEEKLRPWRNPYRGAFPFPPAAATSARSAAAKTVSRADSRIRCVTRWTLLASTSPLSQRICSISIFCGAKTVSPITSR